MENRAQSSACAGLDIASSFQQPCRKWANILPKAFVAPSALSTPRSVGEGTGADQCSFERVAVHRALFVRPLLGLLMKESNWIFWVGAVSFRRGRGRAEPPEERGDEGDKPAGWITTVPFSLLLSLPKVGDYCVHEQGGWWESISWVQQGQVMWSYANSALNANVKEIIECRSAVAIQTTTSINLCTRYSQR